MANINIGDWGIKAGALVLAVFLWFHAITEQLYETETEIRLLIVDPSPGSDVAEGLIVANEVPSTVRVLAKGRGKDLLRLDGDAFVLRVQVESNNRTYRLAPSQIEKGATDLDVQISEILEPKEIDVVLDRRMESGIPVQVDMRLEVAEAHIQVGDIVADPVLIRVSGPQSQVRDLQYITTDSVLLQDVSEDVDLELPLRLPERSRLILDPAFVRVRADIQILAEDDLIGVPVAVRNAGSASIRPDPAIVRVKVRGGVDVIAKLDPAEDLDLYVDYLEYQGDGLPVRSADTPHFDVLSVVPARINLIDN